MGENSDFAEQHEAFRNAIRIAYETKRTLIAPMLRLGRPYHWLPFHELAKRYEAQDKPLLRPICAADAKHWRRDLEPCETINDWTEIPWSSIFDLDGLSEAFGIKILERDRGHGWGAEESTVSLSSGSRVMVVDPLTFQENGTAIDAQAGPGDQPPLKRYMSSRALRALDADLVQFGSLVSATRYRTGSQSALRQALTHTTFVTPNHMAAMTAAAVNITNALGGRNGYSTLYLHLKMLNNNTNSGQRELMDAVVLEIFGDIPINQAVSAAMPVIQSSRLANVLKQGLDKDNNNRRVLLDACVEYRRQVDRRYPIYYLVNDLADNHTTVPELFEPLIKAFPCVFSKTDMYELGILDRSWASSVPFDDPGVVYEDLLAPILDILVASKGYSFSEIPETLLTRFMSWQRVRLFAGRRYRL